MDAAEAERLRERLRKLDDVTLRHYVRAAEFLASTAAHAGEEPEQWFVTQFEESKAEWERRHPARQKKKGSATDSVENE